MGLSIIRYVVSLQHERNKAQLSERRYSYIVYYYITYYVSLPR